MPHKDNNGNRPLLCWVSYWSAIESRNNATPNKLTLRGITVAIIVLCCALCAVFAANI